MQQKADFIVKFTGAFLFQQVIASVYWHACSLIYLSCFSLGLNLCASQLLIHVTRENSSKDLQSIDKAL